MKVAVIIDYTTDLAAAANHFPAHRAYIHPLQECGKLVSIGAFGDESGALWVLDVKTIEEAEEIVSGHPFVAAGAIADWKLRPLAYWTARESKDV